MDSSFLSATVTSYSKFLRRLLVWKPEQLTGGLIHDVLIARDIVQQALDTPSKSCNLSDQDKEKIEQSLMTIEQMDLLFKQQASRIKASGFLEEIRSNSIGRTEG